MDLLLHTLDDRSTHRPDPRGRLSTLGHRAALRAFARTARRARVRFMVIGGTFRDVAVRTASTRDIDVVLVDASEMDPAVCGPPPAATAAGHEIWWTCNTCSKRTPNASRRRSRSRRFANVCAHSTVSKPPS